MKHPKVTKYDTVFIKIESLTSKCLLLRFQVNLRHDGSEQVNSSSRKSSFVRDMLWNIQRLQKLTLSSSKPNVHHLMSPFKVSGDSPSLFPLPKLVMTVSVWLSYFPATISILASQQNFSNHGNITFTIQCIVKYISIFHLIQPPPNSTKLSNQGTVTFGGGEKVSQKSIYIFFNFFLI